MCTVCFDPADKARGVIAFVTRRFNRCRDVSLYRGASNLAGGFSRRSLYVVKIPSFNKHIPTVTLREVGTLDKGGTATVLVAICKGHTCRSALVRLRSALVRGGFAYRTTVTTVTRRSVVRRFTAKEPSRGSLAILSSFMQGVGRGSGGSVGSSRLPMRIPNGEPCHGCNAVPLVPNTSRAYNSYKLYTTGYPSKTVPSSGPGRASGSGYVSYVHYVDIYPARSHGLGPLVLTTTSRGLGGTYSKQGRGRLFLWVELWGRPLFSSFSEWGGKYLWIFTLYGCFCRYLIAGLGFPVHCSSSSDFARNEFRL